MCRTELNTENVCKKILFMVNRINDFKQNTNLNRTVLRDFICTQVLGCFE